MCLLSALFGSRRTDVYIGDLDLPSWCEPGLTDELACYITAHSFHLRGRVSGRAHGDNSHLTPEERDEYQRLKSGFLRTC